MASPEAQMCFICEKSLHEDKVIVVKERGIRTLKESSVKRDIPENEQLLKNLKEVVIHIKCQKTYNDEKMILAYIRRVGNVAPKLKQSATLRSEVPTFSFKDHCFLCSNKINSEFLAKQKKKHLEKRNTVHQVQQLAVRETILKAAEKRNDDWGRAIIERLQNVADLVAVDARYHSFCQRQLYHTQSTGNKRGYRPATNVDEAMEYIFSYLTDNSEECQFSLDKLISQIKGDFRPNLRTVKARLLKRYEDDILIIERAKESPVVCFRNTGYKILTDSWYENKKCDPQEERLRVVRAAAGIILEDIRSEVYNTTEYPPSDDFFRDVNSVIPKSLRTFFEGVVMENKRQGLENWSKKCVALSHAVISAVRPRSFLSPLLIGISIYLYRKFGSKQLIDILSTFGFSSSYREAGIFELSAIMRAELSIEQYAFTQFIFDNADFNVKTLDGHGTFHAMGGIQCVTPYAAVKPEQNIQRLKKLPSAQYVGEFGSVPLRAFHNKSDSGLKTITIADVDSICPLPNEILPSTADFLWLYGKWSELPGIDGWNGFMEQTMADKDYERSKILCLPFINSPPSQHDTIFTSLLSAVEKFKALNQHTCIVTFDQPLYIKAKDIVSNAGEGSQLNNVVVRLGGFHLLMSFMGSIGYIMAGSGLHDLLKIIYAENSIDKMMSGHAYARAVRAHVISHLVLANIVLQSIEFTEDDRTTMENILCDLDKSAILRVDEKAQFEVIANKFRNQLKKLESNGPTSKLWIQYFRMVCLIKKFIEAERSGNWELHLKTIQEMLPFFHASGHFFYAKCAHLYLQDMLNLEKKMDADEYLKFTAQGYFTIRRSDKFWSGIWSDMTVEQTLMRTMKTSGGLTHGRGISDNVLTKWTLGMVYLYNVCDEIENYCTITSATSEQHVDVRPSRIKRDNDDFKKLMKWFSDHDPFPKTNILMSISTGVVGDESINCHLAQDIGKVGISNTIGNNFGSVKFQRKNKVIPLSAVNSSIRLDNETITINPLTLFQRMCIAKQSNEELKEYLQFELAPFPLSLFTEEGMRKGTKSSLYTLFKPLPHDTQFGNKTIHVVDGGYLPHKVVWQRNNSFASICASYVRYVESHHGSNAVIIFDGYPTDSTHKNTKSAERLRRSRKHISADIVFDETMTVQVTQEKFLANEKNKVRLIDMLKKKFEEKNFVVKQSEEDADVLIVNTAISMAPEFDAVIIISEDIDLLILLTGLTASHDFKNIYMRKPGKGKTAEQLYSPTSLKYDEAFQNVLFFHAFGGCDTTSSLFGQGKTKFFTTVQKYPHLNDLITVFKDPDAEQDTIAEAGERFLVAVYGGEFEKTTLNQMRYQCFTKSVTKSKFNLAALPPTSNAAKFHSLRTYHQLQSWHGVDKNPQEWGWKRTKNGLDPVTTTEDPAPRSLLHFISCKCKKGCGGACSCRRAGLNCSNICGFCNGQTCQNVPEYEINDDDEEQNSESVFDRMTNENENVLYVDETIAP